MFSRRRLCATSFALCCMLTGIGISITATTSSAFLEDQKVERADLSKADAKYAVTMEVPTGAFMFNKKRD